MIVCSLVETDEPASRSLINFLIVSLNGSPAPARNNASLISKPSCCRLSVGISSHQNRRVSLPDHFIANTFVLRIRKQRGD